jgi:hypothetical protein
MLRGLVAGLLVANAIFWAWTQGWLTGLTGIDPQGDREPQRLAQQQAPERIRVLAPGSLAKAAPPPVCLEAGPFTPGELARIESAARASLPDGAWLLIRREKPGSWMTYMGRYNNKALMQKRTEELKRLNVAFEEVDFNPDLEPGFTFGRYGRYDDAIAALRHLQVQKVKQARIVQLAAPSVSYTVRVPKADAGVQASAANLREAFNGKSFGGCKDSW